MVTLRNARGSIEIDTEDIGKLSAYHALEGRIERIAVAYLEETGWAVYVESGVLDLRAFQSADLVETVLFMRTLGNDVKVLASVDFVLEGIDYDRRGYPN